MPACAPDIAVTKIVTVRSTSRQSEDEKEFKGVPSVQGTVTVLDASSGTCMGVLDGPTVTARRTAAVSMYAVQLFLGRDGLRRACVVGTGVQAIAHAEALAEVCGVQEIVVAARDVAKAQQFAASLQQRYPEVIFTSIPLSDLSSLCSSSSSSSSSSSNNSSSLDVLISVTSSKTPVVPDTLDPRTLVVGVGAYTPQMAEIPPPVIQGRRIVVDDLQGARAEAGDLIQAGGLVDWTNVRDLTGLCVDGELESLVSSRVVPTVFKSVGHAAWDLAAARVAVSMLSTGD
jgi:1-piperideine-2-carboxylate/1-pyrroline-2-carboxylate reductase [NAD(P)H]